MTKDEQYILHLTNRVHQLEQLLEAEKVKNFELRRFFVELRFLAKPILSKLEKVRSNDV
jgi:uncharacterized protein (DUF2461 family)